MALEAVVFQQDQFVCGFKDLNTLTGIEQWSYGFHFEEGVAHSQTLLQGGGFGFNPSSDPSLSSIMHSVTNASASPEYRPCAGSFSGELPRVKTPAATLSCRRKRRRTRSIKNKEEIENQRMTHIAVERNRRKQMNEYLSVLRSLMPPSYVQRGDQASIVGGAINYVKELEQLLQSLEVNKRMQQQSDTGFSSQLIFSDFLSFPQYSACSDLEKISRESISAKKRSATADVEVTMAESHANLKILSKRYPKQLFSMVTGLQSLGLHVLHLNVTSFHQVALCTLCVKVEEDCQLSSVHEIAAAVCDMIGRLQDEVAFM